MDHPLLVRVIQPQRGLHENARGLIFREGAAGLDQFAKIHARHVLGDQVMDAAILARIMGSHQIGTIEFGLQANFPNES
jgi:hypothetical protein